MFDEHDIHQAFTKGDMSYRDAVRCLLKLGYDPEDADRIVGEWAEGADDERLRYEEEQMISDYKEDLK